MYLGAESERENKADTTMVNRLTWDLLPPFPSRQETSLRMDRKTSPFVFSPPSPLAPDPFRASYPRRRLEEDEAAALLDLPAG